MNTHTNKEQQLAIPTAIRSGDRQSPVHFADQRPEAALQMKWQAMLNAHTWVSQMKANQPVVQRAHMPQVGSKIRYPAKGPKEGDQYVVLEVNEGGLLKLQAVSNKKTSNISWQTDKIWLEYEDSPKDTDKRLHIDTWAAMDPVQKTAVYNNAKELALGKIKSAIEGYMINTTVYKKLKKDLTVAMFIQIRAGEWQYTYEEKDGRIWQFTIDMDKPLETSWQEPHVGWEVKLMEAGANHAGKKHLDFPKQQGHIWLNDVPEFRV